MADKKITAEDIGALAKLSQIEITEDEQNALVPEIESILSYISEISSVAAELPAHVVGAVKNVLREDSDPHESGIHTEALLGAAPSRKENYVQVKKILG
jgi:aspartyl-tRNA(Asn)/glutamyl-tRNA(Gln) amidotransferase subunit C